MKSTLTTLSLAVVLALAAFVSASAATQPSAPAKLSKQQLQSLIASAKTSADHERIAEYYEAAAQRDLAQATEHEQMAQQFKQNSLVSSPKFVTGSVNHCEYLVKSLRQNAAKLEALARDHEQMAQRAAGQ